MAQQWGDLPNGNSHNHGRERCSECGENDDGNGAAPEPSEIDVKGAREEEEGQHSLHDDGVEVDLQECLRNRIEQMPLRNGRIDSNEDKRREHAHDEKADRVGKRQISVVDPAQHC